jgi:hypothetical protein
MTVMVMPVDETKPVVLEVVLAALELVDVSLEESDDVTLVVPELTTVPVVVPEPVPLLWLVLPALKGGTPLSGSNVAWLDDAEVEGVLDPHATTASATTQGRPRKESPRRTPDGGNAR